MLTRNGLLVLGGAAAATFVIYLIVRNEQLKKCSSQHRDRYRPVGANTNPSLKRWGDSFPDDQYVEVPLSTSPEELFINGEYDSHVVRTGDGSEAIRHGDIALGEGFGMGEGTFGFGRNGSSMMA